MAQRGEQGGGRSGRGGRDSRRHSRQGGFADGVNAVPVAPRNALSPPAQQAQASQQASTPAPEISRTSTPIQRTATPAPPPAEQAPKAPSAPYAYEYLSDEMVASWQDSGRQKILDAAKEADEMTMSGTLQELVRSALDGRLDAAEAGAVVKQIVADKQQDDGMKVQTLFLDTLSLLDDADTKHAALSRMLIATDIDPEVIRQELDIPLLQALNLVRFTFDRIRARKTTNIYYRQANFNLLREETEGYAKLMTEYFNIAEEAGGNREVSTAVAEDAFQRVKALVGAFDLDPGRVLDITMDISANALVKAVGFIIKFYRCSSWWPDDGLLDNVDWESDGLCGFPTWALPNSERPASIEEEEESLAAVKRSRDERFWDQLRTDGMEAFFRLGARRIVNYDSVADVLENELPVTIDTRGNQVNEDKRKRINEDRKYMRETRTLPPSGNSDAAQLLGFKLRYYASSVRDAKDDLPENLMHFTALLIKIGFISLRDVWPHLYPSDDQMPEERTRLEKEKAEREAKEKPGGAPNALALASALTDDTLPLSRSSHNKGGSGDATPRPDKKDDAAKDELPPPPNQKIMLLKALLALGTLPEAFFILGRFPWLMEVDTSLPPYLHRIVKHMLSGVAETVRPLANRPGLADTREQLNDTVAGLDGAMKFGLRQGRRPPQKWLQLESFNVRDGLEGRYYYTDWVNSVPVCRDLDEVLVLCDTLVGFLGVKIGQDVNILGTLVRLAKKNLAEDGSDANRSRWLELMKRLLVPALSLSKHNPNLTDEVYQLLLFYPITIRYEVYTEWFTGRVSRYPDIKVAFDYNRAEAKEVLRRVSNDNAKTQARALGKVAYSAPGVLITYMISQLESYSNQIPALVECTKYFPKLAYDVMTWCLINSLRGQGRDRMQGDGMLTSPWLQSLSQFVASLFSRYETLNPSPILQYLASELRNGDSTDLQMFDQVLAEMAGIKSDMEFNDAQVLAMAGGEQLQAQVVQQLADVRHTKKNLAKRLIKALAEPRLIGQTLISIAQERQIYAHHESSSNMPLKVLGNNLDKIQQVFAQYLEVLKTNLKPEQFEAAVPDVVSLISDFGLQPGVAFTICRAAISYRMNEHDESKRQEEQEQRKRRLSHEKSQPNGDVEMQESDAKSAVNGEPAHEKGNTPAIVKSESQDGFTPQTNGIPTSEGSPWHPVLEPIIQRLKPVTGDLDDRVGVPFFVTFWTLSQSDVVVYTECYHQEIDRLQAQLNEIARDRSNRTSSAIQQQERRKKELQENQNKLRAEVKGRINSYTKLSNRLSQQEKHHWFDRSRVHADIDSRHVALLQECFLPRAMLSSLDAHYSFLMLKMLHDKGAPGFGTLQLLTQLFLKQELAAIIFQCTALEAQHFGRFLNEVLKLIAGWHADKATYEKDALGKHKLPGFVMRMDEVLNPATWKYMDYEVYRQQVFNWHKVLLEALQVCFESGEYMHIRNGIIVLKAVVGIFPAVNFHGTKLITAVEKLSNEEKRQDLKLMALSLLAPLRTREKAWVLPAAFRLGEGKPRSRATSAKPETPQPGAGTPKLNAAAADFKPTPATLANGTARHGSGAGIEDGEVEEEKKGADTKMRDAPAVKKELPAPSQKPIIDKEQSKARTPEFRATPSAPAKDQQRAATKPPTPAPTAPRSTPQVNGTPRQELSRPPSTQPPPPRSAHDLPSRPERSIPRTTQPLPTPPITRPDARHTSRGEDRSGRLERPSDVRPSRESSPGHRSRPRTPPAPARAASRDERPRAPRDDTYTGSRHDAPSPALHSRPPDIRERVNGSMAPPSVQAPQNEKPGFIPSVATAPPTQPSRPSTSGTQNAQPPANDPFVNPARMALIGGQGGAAEGRSREAPQSEKERRRDRDGRHGRAPPSFSQGPDARPNDRAPAVEPPREPQSRRDQPTDLAPSGPRHGRLNNQDIGPPTPQDTSFGRLDRPQDVPSGPRPPNGPSGKHGRNFSGPQPPVSTRPNEPPMPSPAANRPPESPAAFRPQPPRQPSAPERHNSGPQLERQPSSTSVPPTPAVQDESNVHPSRRLNVQPPKIQTNMQAVNGARSATSPTSAPPSGPRGAGGRAPAGAPTGPSPVNSAAPTGPSFTMERQRRDRQYANINAQLQSGNGAPGPRVQSQDVSFRGASSRQNSFTMPSAAIPSAPQAVASPMEPPPRRNEPTSRHDGPPSRPESRAEPRPDLFQQQVGDDGGRARRREDERGERHRISRNPSCERRRDDVQPPQRAPPPLAMEESRDKRGAPRDERRPRDERDRREGPPRESRGPERGPRGDEGRRPPEMPGSFAAPPPPEWARGNGGRNSGRDAPQMDDGRRGGGRGGGSGEELRGPRRDEERRDSGRGAPREEGPPDGRKRRLDDGPFDSSKRRRSGR